MASSKIEKPLLIERGTSGNWTYYKYNNGIIEQFLNETLTTAISTAVGSLYQTPSNTTRTMPVEMTSVLDANVAAFSDSFSVWTALYSISNTQVAFRLLSAATRTSTSYNVKAHIIGTY